MDILSLVQDEGVKQIIIEKKAVLNDETSNDERSIAFQLNVRVLYDEPCSKAQ